MSVDDSYTKSLLHFNGADASIAFTDESGKVWTVYGNAQLDIDQKKFGTASGLFDGNGDYVTTPHHNDFVFDNGDFSIDFWVRATKVGQSSNSCILSKCNSNSSWVFLIPIMSGTYNLKFYAAKTTPWDLINGATIGTLTQNVWSHVAVCRSGANVYCFLDGVLGSTTAVSTNSLINTTSTMMIGGVNTTNTYFDGHIDELRISKGIARWTEGFTPPTEEYSPGSYIIIPTVTTTDTPNAPSINTAFPPAVTTTDIANAPSYAIATTPPSVTTTDIPNVPSWLISDSYIVPTAYRIDIPNAPSISNYNNRHRILLNATGRHFSLKFQNNVANEGLSLRTIGLKLDRITQRDVIPLNAVGTHFSLKFAGTELLIDTCLDVVPYQER